MDKLLNRRQVLQVGLGIGAAVATPKWAFSGERMRSRSDKRILSDVRRYIRGGGYDRPWMSVGKVIHWKNDKDLLKIQVDPHAFTIISDYGSRHFINGKPRLNFYGGIGIHGGIDFSAPHGVPVLSPFDGTVRDVFYHPERGYVVRVETIVRHEDYDPVAEGHDENTPEFILEAYRDTIRAEISHNGKMYVKKGDRVRRGDILTEVWSTGSGAHESIPHAHYEFQVNGGSENVHYNWIGVSSDLNIRAFAAARVNDIVTVPQFDPNMSYDTPPRSLQIATSPLPRATEVAYYLSLMKNLIPIAVESNESSTQAELKRESKGARFPFQDDDR